jgi:hypothetical protein
LHKEADHRNLKQGVTKQGEFMEIANEKRRNDDNGGEKGENDKQDKENYDRYDGTGRGTVRQRNLGMYDDKNKRRIKTERMEDKKKA